MTVQTYSPSDVIITFGGYVLENWDTVSVKRTTPSFKIIKGIRGKNTRVRSQNTSAEVTLTIPITSIGNTVLGEIVAQDELNGTGRLIMTIKDVQGFEVFSTAEAFVEKPADKEYGAEMSSRAWTIHCLSSQTAMSDNSALGSIFDLIF